MQNDQTDHLRWRAFVYIIFNVGYVYNNVSKSKYLVTSLRLCIVLRVMGIGDGVDYVMAGHLWFPPASTPEVCFVIFFGG